MRSGCLPTLMLTSTFFYSGGGHCRTAWDEILRSFHEDPDKVHSISLQRIRFTRAVPNKLEILSMHRVPAMEPFDTIPKQIVHVDLAECRSTRLKSLMTLERWKPDLQSPSCITTDCRTGSPRGLQTFWFCWECNYRRYLSFAGCTHVGHSNPTTLRAQGTRRSLKILGGVVGAAYCHELETVVAKSDLRNEVLHLPWI